MIRWSIRASTVSARVSDTLSSHGLSTSRISAISEATWASGSRNTTSTRAVGKIRSNASRREILALFFDR